MEVSGQLHFPAALTLGNGPWYPLYRTRGEHRTNLKALKTRKISTRFRKSNRQFCRPDRGFVTVVTELSRLSSLHSNYIRNFVRFFPSCLYRTVNLWRFLIKFCMCALCACVSCTYLIPLKTSSIKNSRRTLHIYWLQTAAAVIALKHHFRFFISYY